MLPELKAVEAMKEVIAEQIDFLKNEAIDLSTSESEDEIADIYENILSSARKLKTLVNIQYTLKRIYWGPRR